MNPCIIIPIVAALVGALLGWLLRHLTCNCDDDLKEIEKLRDRNRKLEADLQACLSEKDKAISLQSNEPLANTTTSAFAARSIDTSDIEVEPSLNFDGDLAKSIFGKKIVADDLKVVEGIGPKISDLFNENGIKTWYQLSKASVDRCQEILNIGGKRFEIHKPTTWPQQAGLAFEGKWQELKDLQDYLDGGKER
ncbi:hypothetical protein [Aquimarina agarilytica]|uniref:hypothetical protein n=1 Tax=Aquimarina agarilytica TaxID=1087449 RepID=UPI0002891A90|nr:hypothetical protein [Aquimarina agarilytica]